MGMKRLFIVVFFVCLGSWRGYAQAGGEAPMEKTELDALNSAIQGFVGNWWNGSDLYPDPCGWTPIQGVSCDIFDGLWYVTALNIGPTHDNSLSCAPNAHFRQQLFELKHLKSLSFFSCFVSTKGSNSVSLPTDEWLKLAGSLESLEFRSNDGLTGKIPASMGSLSKLQSLVLLNNGFVGEIPENFGGLIKLKRLVLAGNSLTGPIARNLGRLSELLILDLSRNLLSGSLPPSLGNLTSLLKLDLSDNKLSGILPNEIGDMGNLTLLDVSNNSFYGGLKQSFEKMSSLEEVILSNNPIGGELKSINWKSLENLVILDLSNMGLKGDIPDSLSALKRLRFLGLSRNNLTGNPSPKLATLPVISAIYLFRNNLSGDLKFSEKFYGKMGRRFGAWDNPNLCYPIGTLAANNAPYGVKPCQEEEEDEDVIKLMKTPVKKTSLDMGNSNSAVSNGCSGLGIEGFWWKFVGKTITMILLTSRLL
ncbi:piriformospora indica-insensitive protein 2-like isoform X1 [Cucurbita pepo subsp. pepo]|uniref:piriformospora indica-insensitive protein 2-like isoform X1 n=2 Tax=Cucurbita pepo subsp. pepo TaxID=3664 RepID=UPI000C9D8622|nr:piriformospora indica-insensitive protein 2-like isoform X1 [Cucurbita pepo subsp. pepo]XP_023511516.1 piriformospora indica-insensitive protein 2-like isoform X1 [Cucurbita pepo subsp. pepo]